jgi:hypothetical protein
MPCRSKELKEQEASEMIVTLPSEQIAYVIGRVCGSAGSTKAYRMRHWTGIRLKAVYTATERGLLAVRAWGRIGYQPDIHAVFGNASVHCRGTRHPCLQSYLK